MGAGMHVMVGVTWLQIHTWDRFDVFKVAALTQGKPLYTVAMAIFEALGLMVSAGAAFKT